MEIAFLTLFLGLTSGAQPVALHAGDKVAAIELVLDGHAAAKIDRPPWTGMIDFGPDLLPHHLEARGLGADGSDTSSAEQWVNLPRPPAEVLIILEGFGKQRTVRLGWDSVTGDPPSETHLSLDGVPLALDQGGRAAIRVPAAGAAHVLSAELRFPSGVAARKDVVLTGDWGSDVATELTAVPVRARARGKPLAAKDLEGRLADAGKPLRIAAVEQAEPQVFVVRTERAKDALLGRHSDQRSRLPQYGAQYGQFTPSPRIHFHFVAPTANLHRTANVASEVFDISQDLALPGVDFVRFLAAVRYKLDDPGQPRLADAVAVAGLHALGRQTPRAVVLLVAGGDDADASLFSAAAVRKYLAAIGVPFFVWSLGWHPSSGAAWGKVDDISQAWGLQDAYRRLEREVNSQQIVWLEGRHLPQSITFSGAAGKRGDLDLVSGGRP